MTEIIDKIVKYGGVAISAHVDTDKGLFNESNGKSLDQVLDNPNIYAMELRDNGCQKPPLYDKKGLEWTAVRWSDTHNFGDKNKKFGNDESVTSM